MEQEPKPRKNSYRDNLANTLRELRDQGDKEVAQRLLENKRETDLYKKEHDDHRQELSISRSERKEKNETIQKLYNSFEKSIGYEKLIEEELSKIDNNSTGFDKVERVFDIDDVSIEIIRQNVNTGEYEKIPTGEYNKGPVLVFRFGGASEGDLLKAIKEFKKENPDIEEIKIITILDNRHSNTSHINKAEINTILSEEGIELLSELEYPWYLRDKIHDEYFIGGGKKIETADYALHACLSYENAPWFKYAKEADVDSISMDRFEEYLPTDKFNWCDKDCLERYVFDTLPEEVRPLASLEIIKRNFQKIPKVFDIYFCGGETGYDLNFHKISDDGRIWNRLFVPFLNNDNFKKCCVEIISPLVAKMDSSDIIRNEVLLDRLKMIDFPMGQFMKEAKDLMEKNIEYEKAKFNKYWSE